MSGFFGHQRVKSAGVGHDRRHTRAFLGRRDIKIDNACGVPARRRFRRARHRRPGRCRIATQLQPARRGICRVSRRLAGSYEGADDLICMNCHVDNHVAGATKLSGPCADADPSVEFHVSRQEHVTNDNVARSETPTGLPKARIWKRGCAHSRWGVHRQFCRHQLSRWRASRCSRQLQHRDLNYAPALYPDLRRRQRCPCAAGIARMPALRRLRAEKAARSSASKAGKDRSSLLNPGL